MTDELSALQAENFKLKCALLDLLAMERTVTPDMGGKRRTFAYMRNGKVLAECIDRGWELLGYDWSPTDPAHGGKIASSFEPSELPAGSVVLLAGQEDSTDQIETGEARFRDHRHPALQR